MLASARLGETPFAVLDVETTGFYFTKDRVVEVAVLRLRADGSVGEEYETLVNPRRDVGPTEIHHITATDVMHAPAFGEIAADIATRMRDAVLVGHNLRFDLTFLAAEFARLDVSLPGLPQLCTLRLAHHFLPVRTRSLRDCCAELGIEHSGAHSALGDARATARLLRALIDVASEEGVRDLGELGCEPLEFPPPWITGRASGKRCTRSEASRASSEERGYLARLVSRLPGDEATTADEAEYLEILDRALEDRNVAPSEGDALMDAARRCRLTRADVERAHNAYVQGLVAAAWADGIVTDPELRDLVLVGEMLGVRPERVIRLVESHPVTPPVPVTKEDLRGKRVCFTGSLEEYTFDGEPLTRQLVQALATDAGMVVSPSVTKKLDVLVVADGNSLSGKAAKARDYGIRIIVAPAFFAAIGANVE